MNPGRRRLVPDAAGALAATALLLLFAGCAGSSSSPGTESLVGQPALSPERAAAKADIRMQAEAADDMPYPDAFQADQTARLVARGEPRTSSEVEAIQAELAAIALLQKSASTPEEIAELDARAAALRQAALARQPNR